MSVPDERLLSVEEVATYLGVSEGTIRGLRSEGRFAPAFRIGKHLRWHRSDIDGWLLDQKER